jgi:hypothetical protein
MEAREDYEYNPHGFMEEVPNLSYVFSLVKDDLEFRNKFLAIIKREFPMELEKYLLHMSKDEPRAAAELVHKLKYRISALGMEKSFQLTENHEERLHIGDTSLDFDFRIILKKIVAFLEKI